MTKNLHWYALDLVIDLEAAEAVAYALMEAGALGTEFNSSADQVTGYFESVPDREHVRAELAAALRIYQLPSSAVRNMSLREVADEDWLGEWKKSWQPVAVGERFLEPREEAARERSRAGDQRLHQRVLDHLVADRAQEQALEPAEQPLEGTLGSHSLMFQGPATVQAQLWRVGHTAVAI